MDLESCVLKIIPCFQYPIHLSNKNIEFYRIISIETNIQEQYTKDHAERDKIGCSATKTYW